MKKRKCALILPFLLLAVTVSAQDLGVRLDALLGFQGFYKTGAWVPLTVIVANDAARIRGDLEVVVPGSRSFRETDDLVFRQSLDVDPGQRRNIPFLVPILNPSKTIRIRISAGDVTIEQEINPLSGSLPGRIVAVVGRGRALRFLQGFLAGESGTHLAYPHWEDLPDHWAGYDSVQVLSVSAERLTNLSGDQLEAINSWVRLGGTLIIDGGTSLTPRSLETVGRFVDVRYRGRGVLDGLGSPYVDLAIPNSESALSFEGVDLAYRARLDKGSVFVLAYDSELSTSVPGWEDMFTTILTDNQFDPESPFPLKDTFLFEQLREQRREVLPSRLMSLALFIPYLGLAYILGHRWRGKNNSLGIVIVAGIFAVLGLVYLSSMNGNPYFTRLDLHLVEVPPDSEVGLCRTFVALGSARDGDASFSFANLSRPPLIRPQGTEPVVGGLVQTVEFEAFSWEYLSYAMVASVPYHVETLDGDLRFTAFEDLAMLAVASRGQVWDFGLVAKGDVVLLSEAATDNLGTWVQTVGLDAESRLVLDNVISYRSEDEAVAVALPAKPRNDLVGPNFIDELRVAGAFTLLGDLDG